MSWNDENINHKTLGLHPSGGKRLKVSVSSASIRFRFTDHLYAHATKSRLFIVKYVGYPQHCLSGAVDALLLPRHVLRLLF